LRLNSYPVSFLIFSSLPLVVNPVGVTTYRCYFSQIIVYNLVTIYGIATKLGIRLHPYTDFQCTKLQGNQIMPLCLIATFTPLRKEEEKKRRHSANFWRFISRKRLAWFWNVRRWRWPAFPALKSFGFIKVSRRYVYVSWLILLCMKTSRKTFFVQWSFFIVCLLPMPRVRLAIRKVDGLAIL